MKFKAAFPQGSRDVRVRDDRSARRVPLLDVDVAVWEVGGGVGCRRAAEPRLPLVRVGRQARLRTDVFFTDGAG